MRSSTGSNLAGALAGATLALLLGAPRATAQTPPLAHPPRLAAGWLSWRGPQQNGTSLEKNLPARVDPKTKGSWIYPLCGRGTPVIADGRVYAMGYLGAGPTLLERLVCLDERSGALHWEHCFTDLPTDVIYSRYAIGSPTVDAETGLVYCLSTGGLLCCFDPKGRLLWQHSMMSEYGRLTFPNGRTGAPLLDSGLCVVHTITSGWGPGSPARDRFYAFDRRTGECVWTSTPGGPPQDSSFCMPVVAWENGRRVLYAGLGGGHLVCVDVRTGDPIWRFRMATGGVNSSPVLHGDSILAVHGKENMDSSTIGRLVAVRRGAQPGAGKPGPVLIGKSHELWRNDLVAFSSSPVLVGDRVYLTGHTGELHCVDARSGKELWHEKLAPDQIHASPAWGDGKLYVPMNNGSFHILEPREREAKSRQQLQLEGNCLGAPAIANGRIYVHTTKQLYCFAGGMGGAPATTAPIEMARGPAVRLQVIPADVVLAPGVAVAFRARFLDAHGTVAQDPVEGVTWEGLPVSQAKPGVKLIRARVGDAVATARVRVVPGIPHTDDFEDVKLTPNAAEHGAKIGPPRPYWITAGKKWEVRELDGSKVLARTLDNPLFQRSMSFIGHPTMSGYTMQVDIRSDGNRRTLSSAGVVNQRYLIVLKGNHQELEVSSNMELLKAHVPFKWKAGVWYRMKTRVDVAADGSGVVRAKVWPRSQEEPKSWTIEVPHAHAHRNGSPGIYGFTPQSRFRVYLDNLSLTENE